MKVTIDIDCTPAEARAFFGLPDLEPVNVMVVGELKRRTQENLETIADPERFFAQMMSFSGKSMEGLRAMMQGAMSGSGEKDRS